MAKNNNALKSKYLMVAYQSFYGFHYLTFKPYISFEKGQEKEFMETIIEFRDYCKQDGGHADARAEDELKGIMDISTLNWDEIWEKTKIEDYCGPLKAYIERLLYFVDWETFKKKVNQSNDYVIVRRLYYLYCYANKISDEKENANYEEYLTAFLERTKKTPEGILCKMICDFENSFERGHGVDTVESYYYKAKRKVFTTLIRRANLDTIVQFGDKKISLKNLLFYRILKRGDVSTWLGDSDDPNRKEPSFKVDNKELLNVLLSACSDFIFSGEPLDNSFDDYDRATLTYMMGNIEGALKIFDKEEYPVYDQNQLNSLLETGIYQTNNSPFVDRFATMVKFICVDNPKAIMKNGATRPEFMDFIYSSKVRVISYATLMILKNYLSEEEFNDYLTHINDEGIHLYFGNYLGLSSDENVNPLSNAPTVSDCVTSSILDPTYPSRLENDRDTRSILDPTYRSRLETTIENCIKNASPLPNTLPAIITLDYAVNSDLNFMDQAKLDAIIKELNKHKSGEKYVKSL